MKKIIMCILSMIIVFLNMHSVLGMGENKFPHEALISKISNDSENPLAMFKTLKTLSLLNRKFAQIFNDNEIVRALLSHQCESYNLGEGDSLLLLLIKKDQHKLLANFIKQARTECDFVDWDSLDQVEKKYWYILRQEVKSALRSSPIVSTIQLNRSSCLDVLLAGGSPILTTDFTTHENVLTLAIKIKSPLVATLIAQLKKNARELDVLSLGNSSSSKPLLPFLAQYGHKDVIESLYHQGCSLETPCKGSGATALLVAADEGQIETIEKLIELGADIYAELPTKLTALSLLIEKGFNPSAIRLLNLYSADKFLIIIKNINEPNNPLSRAIFRRDFLVIKSMIDRLPAEVEPKILDDLLVDPPSVLPLMSLAAKYGQIGIIDALYQRGCSLEMKYPKNGSTPINFAAQSGHTQTVQRLAELGADINVTNNKQWTALLFAASENKWETMQKLLELGAHVNARGECGATAIKFALNGRNTEAIKTLLLAGADIHLEQDQTKIFDYISEHKDDLELQSFMQKNFPK